MNEYPQEIPIEEIQTEEPQIAAAADETLSTSWLDRSAASILAWDWEKIAWAGLLIVAVVVRLVALDNRSMSHDESEHAWFSYNLYAGKGYEHSPVYHGPFAYHVLALFYLMFGDSTIIARVPTALFGVGVVGLIWLLRSWLGKSGAWLAALFVTFSPALLHYSRHIRHDIFEIFWALLFIIAVFRYIAAPAGEHRSSKWLYITSASLVLMLATKEVAFIYGAVVGVFVLAIILYQWQGWRLEPDIPEEDRQVPLRVSRGDWLVLASAVVVASLGALIFRLFNLADTVGTTSSNILAVFVVVLPALAAVALAAWHVRGRSRSDTAVQPWFSPATDIAILLGTLILPWLAPFVIDALGYDPLNYNFPGGILPTLSVLIGMIGMAIAIGILWDSRRWLIAAGIFTGLFALLFTTFFTNGKGLATGVVGSLGYWLSQQEVARGSQPWYYYFIVTPLYEFLPLLLSIPVILGAFFRRSRVSVILLMLVILSIALWLAVITMAGDDPGGLGLVGTIAGALALGSVLLAAIWGGLSRFPQSDRYFLAFLPFWVLFTWVGYTVAGEKMPWLTTHIALPMCIAGGWWLGQVVERVDWRAFWQRGGIWLAILVIPLVAAVASLLGTEPFRNRTITGLSDTTQWLAAAIVIGVILYLMSKQINRLGWSQARKIIGLTIVFILGLWTIRTTYMLNFINQDYVSEYLFYAHASPDPRQDMADIERLSQRMAGDQQLKVAYDDDSGWPFNWYLRDWPNATYFGANPSRDNMLDAPVVLVGNKNLDKARPYLRRDYQEFSRRLIWWPDEGYKGTSLQKIWQGIKDPEKRQAFLDVVIWRKYPNPMAQWPLVHRYSLFVQKDAAAQMWDFGAQPQVLAAITDPYEEGFREIASAQMIGSGPGSEPGRLQNPRNVAVSADGEIFVADSGNHRIQVFSSEGFLQRQWGSQCELYAEGQPGCIDPDGNEPLQLGDGQFMEPWGIAIGPDGNVYVADTWNHRIQVFDTLGNFVTKWGNFDTTGGEAFEKPGAFWGPRAIAIDGAGNLFVTDTGNKRILVFGSSGEFLGQYGGGGAIEGRFEEPVGLDIFSPGEGQAGGELFVADTWNRRIQKFNVSFQDELSGSGAPPQPIFVFEREWPVEGWLDQGIANKPYLAVDSEGTVYATDPETWRVLVFDSDGNFVATFGNFGTDALSFKQPIGIATDMDDRVFVADAENHRIMAFPPIR
ncbi:MAG: TIGR03663 family protein [Chloroflexota bacterium]|nr:TIGR03663 family protein [Chloroflexota bacterium]